MVVALAASLVVPAAPARATTPEPSVTCARCIVVDEDGRVLFARNPRDRYPNASTTKMVTALVVVQHADPDETVVVSPAAAAVGGGGLDLSAGDVFTVDQLMYAMLLDSSNEAAEALAEHVGGNVGEFVAMMNRYLASIGADRTHFANPHGLDAPGHYASAADLALIGRHVLDVPYLADIVKTPRATIETPRGPASFDNRNLLLESYRRAIGIKTGRTLGAGNVLVAAARRGGHTLIAVAMHSYDAFVDDAALLDYGFARERVLDRPRTLLATGQSVAALVFDSGATSVVAGASLEGVAPADPSDIEMTFVPADDLAVPLSAGDPIGTIELSTPTGTVGSVPAVARSSVPARTGSFVAGILGGVMEAVASAFGVAG